MDGPEAVQETAAFHARHGTTAFLPTTVTAPADTLRRALTGIAKANHGGARIMGVHLEGPFINPAVLGAQPPFAIPPDIAWAEELCRLAPIRVATIAPEIDPDGALLTALSNEGIRVQLGHTACSYEQARQALDRGAAGFTHLFNAMSPLHHRSPGAVGCALAHAGYAEIIPDLLHVAPGAILAALRAIPGLYAITDAVAAAGMPDGEYRLGTHAIYKQSGAVRLGDGTLAGSVLTMDQALRNLLALGLTLAEASARVSTIPAAYTGFTDRGHLAPGLAADFVIVDDRGNLLHAVAEGICQTA